VKTNGFSWGTAFSVAAGLVIAGVFLGVLAAATGAGRPRR
jgi:hypothetical protein